MIAPHGELLQSPKQGRRNELSLGDYLAIYSQLHTKIPVMTIVTPIPLPQAETNDREAFDRLRGKIIDSFGLLEQAIDAALFLRGVEKSTKPFGQRIVDLQNILKADPKFTAAKTKRLEKWVVEAQRAMLVRNDLVHSPMELETRGNQAFAFFRHCASTDFEYPIFRMLSGDDMTKLVRQVGILRNQLKQLLD